MHNARSAVHHNSDNPVTEYCSALMSSCGAAVASDQAPSSCASFFSRFFTCTMGPKAVSSALGIYVLLRLVTAIFRHISHHAKVKRQSQNIPLCSQGSHAQAPGQRVAI